MRRVIMKTKEFVLAVASKLYKSLMEYPLICVREES